MTPDQTTELIDRISLIDQRFLPDSPKEAVAMTALWVGILHDVPAGYAMQAVSDHYAASPYPIKPSDISTRWRATVRSRLDRHTGTFDPHQHPEVDPDDPTGNAYVAALRAERHAVATGYRQPTPVRSLTASLDIDDVRAMRQQKDLKAFIKQTGADAKDKCAERVKLIKRYPDLVAQAAEALDRPFETWNGYIGPEHDGTGRLNNSPIRRRLVAILDEAERRTNA